MSLLFTVIPVGKVFACSDGAPCKPYFKTFGGDVFAGEWFAQNGQCDTAISSNYQDTQTPLSGDLLGGILAYTMMSGNSPIGGASSQYGAQSLANIEGDGAANKGFYSSGVGQPLGSPSILT